ncbi:MAG: argininosuccinate lyase, partial [Archaeoglobaceae archaeon]
QASLRVLNGMLKGLNFNKEAFESKASEGFSIATEIADMLVKDFRIPFRDAHKIVARLVSQRLNVTAENVEKIAREFGYEIKVNEAKLLDTIDVKKAVERRKITGGTAKEEVERMIKVRKEKILKQRRKLLRVKKRIEARLGLLEREVEKIGGTFRVDWEESQD